MPTLADTAKRLRHRAKLSQRELAKRSGVNLGTLRLIEQGETTDPKVFTARALAQVLGVSIEEFMGLEKVKALPKRRGVRIIRTG